MSTSSDLKQHSFILSVLEIKSPKTEVSSGTVPLEAASLRGLWCPLLPLDLCFCLHSSSSHSDPLACLLQGPWDDAGPAQGLQGNPSPQDPQLNHACKPGHLWGAFSCLPRESRSKQPGFLLSGPLRGSHSLNLPTAECTPAASSLGFCPVHAVVRPLP